MLCNFSDTEITPAGYGIPGTPSELEKMGTREMEWRSKWSIFHELDCRDSRHLDQSYLYFGHLTSFAGVYQINLDKFFLSLSSFGYFYSKSTTTSSAVVKMFIHQTHYSTSNDEITIQTRAEAINFGCSCI